MDKRAMNPSVDPHFQTEPDGGAIRSISSELCFRSDATLGEGPVWDNGTLYWVDITGKALFAKQDGVATAKRFEVGLEVGALTLCSEGKLILATENGFQSFKLPERTLELWNHPEASLRDNRFNDGKCDPQGRFVAGTLNRHGKPNAALYVLDHDRSVRRLLHPVTCSNGLAWSEDGTVLYYIDTPTRCVRAFNYDTAECRLSNERIVIRIPQSHGAPDGMTIDRNGNLWIALWDGWGVECWDPRSGQRKARIDVPVARVTSCVFGGERYDILFITTARQGLDATALARQELAGSIFCAHPGVAGYPATRFNRGF